MSRSFTRGFLGGILVCSWVFSEGMVAPGWGQSGSQGTVTVTVVDTGGGAVSDAQLELHDLATNDVRRAATQDKGAYSFVGLSVGNYKLTVSKVGFQAAIFESITVQAARVTDINVTLQVGAVSQEVVVSANATPLMETTSNAIGTTIDLKHIEELPLGGRNLSPLSTLVPGFTGTFNGMRPSAQSNNVDGIIGNTSRFKNGGDSAPFGQARIEDIQEMTIQTDQLDLNQGFGQANMQVNFVTRRGSNAFHGRLFDNFQSSALNANSWSNNANKVLKGKFHLNDFGASVGGPILRDKLFFFASFAEFKQPGAFQPSNTVLIPAAQQGNFTYLGTNNVLQTVNVLTIAQNSGVKEFSGAPIPFTVNPNIAAEQQAINKSLQYGVLTTGTDPNVNTLIWSQNRTITRYFPTVRLDYNISQTFRVNFAWNEEEENIPTGLAPQFPGPDFAYQGDGTKNKSYTASLGFDWTIRPTLVNQFRGGMLYLYQAGAYKAGSTYQKRPLVFWNIPNTNGFSSGEFFYTTQSNYYPLFNLSDNMTWQRAAHTLSFGVSWYREQDHYWNPPLGYPNINLGLAADDPVLTNNVFSNTGATATLPNATNPQRDEARALYAALVGRVTRVSGAHPVDPKTTQFKPFGAVNLDELQQAYGFFVQDAFRIKPSLTLNYGLRWDFTGDDHDLAALYHGVATPGDLWGPTGLNNQFRPGSLLGNPDPQYVASSHQYKPWKVSPQPSVAIAWNPQFHTGLLGTLTGGQTTIRAGYALRRYTESYQNFWSYASNYGSFFYQSFNSRANLTGAPGTFTPGTVSLGDTTKPPFVNPSPGVVTAPLTYSDTYPESGSTFGHGPGLAGMDPNIAQPRIHSWNFGIQRALGRNNVIEVRYVGNGGSKEWIGINVNEINVFENGFLRQFQAAQANLAINQANGLNSFGNRGLPGQQPLPIFDAAFAGESLNGGFFADYRTQQFIDWLNQGQVGAMAARFTGIGGPNYFCNLVGPAFTPCVTLANYKGQGAGYPINFFQANPFQTGNAVMYLTSAGYSNYNGLQIEFRQQQWHGMQFNANYTYSHSLSLESPPANGDSILVGMSTLRNLRLNYAPSYFDRRHVVHIFGTYDLPLGRGRPFLNHSGLLDRIVGGWTSGTIITYQTGLPFKVTGGYSTFNNIADGGVVLNGITVSQLQDAVGVYRTGRNFVSLINPKYLVSPTGGGANPAFITPNTTPGTIGVIPWLHGPHTVTTDISLTKNIPITERIRFSVQGEFLNAFNHPIFTTVVNTTMNVLSNNFGIGGGSNAFRAIQFRANLEF